MRWPPWSRGQAIRADLRRDDSFRVVASAPRPAHDAPPRGRLTEEQHANLTSAIVVRAVETGQIAQSEAQAWTNELTLDFWSALHALDQLPEGAHRPIAASVPRPPRRQDGERVIAAAIERGAISEQRADFWRGRVADDPATADLVAQLSAPPQVVTGQALTEAEEQAVHDGYMSRFFPRAQHANGRPVTRINPLGAGGATVEAPPPRRGPVKHIHYGR